MALLGSKSIVNSISVLLCLSLCIGRCFGGNILMVTTNSVASPSHYMALSTVTGGLVSNGHNVTLVTNDIKGTKGFPNHTFTQILTFKASYKKEDAEQLEKQAETKAFADIGILEMFRMTSVFMNMVYSNCLDFWNDSRILEQLENSHFDMVLVFPFSSCDVLVAHYLDVPFAVVIPSIRLPTFHEGYIGMPYPLSYVPFNIFGSSTDEMTFVQRLQNSVTPLLYHVLQYNFNRPYRKIQVEHQISPSKSIKELYSHASLYLAHVSLGSDFPRPYTPNYIPIGGLISRPIQPLPEELADFVEGSEDHGVIIFTLGSAVGSLADNGIADIFASVFRKLPQRVLWRHNAEPPANIGNNTMLLKWLPQNDLVGHPKARLLIYHGGSNGVLEAISHGIPMVIIPLVGDQVAHAARVQKKGMGLFLDKTNITEENLMAAVQEVLHNPSYKARAKLFADIHHDMPMTPLERAVYWIEHVMKFGGDHLRPRSADMGIIELYMIDVTLFLCVVTLCFVYVELLVLRRCYQCLCNRSSAAKLKPE